MPRRWGLAAGLAALLFVGGLVLLQQGWAWRQSKLALLTEGPLLRGGASGVPAAGGLLMFGDSRIAMWEPLPLRSVPVWGVGYPGESAIRLAPHFAGHLESSRPAAAFVQMGVNDAVAASLASRSAREAALAASIRAFAEMAAAAEASGVALTISLVVPPIRPELRRRIVYRGAVDSYVQKLNAAIREIAARHGASVVDPMDVLGGADGVVPDAYRLDALHWTPAAYRELDRLVPQIAPSPAPALAEMAG